MDNPFFQQLAQALQTTVEHSLIRANIGKTREGYTSQISIQDVGEGVHIKLNFISYELAHEICQLVMKGEL